MATVAVIGGGRWGKNLVRNFAELGTLRGICDLDQEQARQLAEQHGRVRVYADTEEVMADEELDAVSVAVPAEFHYEVAKAALLAGKHCLVEKPLVLQLDHALELKALAEQRGRILMVGHLLYYHPAVRKLKELIERGALGGLRRLVASRLSFGRIRQEENALWSLGVHDVSVVLYLLGELPESVSARGGSYVTPGVADAVVAVLDFAHGVQAEISVSWLHPFKEQRLVVVGSEAIAVFDDVARDHKLQLYPSKVKWVGSRPVAEAAEPHTVEFGPGEPLREECEHFLTCIADGRRPLTDAEDGIRVLRVLTRCQESLELGGPPRPLDEPDFPGCRIHPTAVVDPGVRIGAGTQIWHFSHVMSGSVIGPDCRIGQNVVLGPEVTIGRNVKIQNNVSVYKGVTLEDDVFCGPSMVFTNVFNPRAHIPRMHVLRETRVGRGATLGANATILCGHRIGCYAFIGAGAVVTKDVPDYGLVYGNPARLLGWVCYCAAKLDFGACEEAKCPECGRSYRKRGDAVAEVSRDDHDGQSAGGGNGSSST